MRAHYTRPVTDDQGVLLPNVQVTVYNPGTTDLIAAVLYGSDAGSDVLANPYVSNTGVIDFYLDLPSRVRIGVVQGGLPEQYYEDVDVLAAGLDGQHTGTGSNSVALGSTATSAGPSATAIGPAASAGGSSSTALGSSANALGDSATALGSAASATSLGGVSVGSNAAATADAAVAVGRSTQAAGVSSMALGDGATATHARAVAIGPTAATTQDDQVMIGSGTGSIVEIAEGSPLIMTDTNGNRWRITVGTDGVLSAAAM